MTLEELQQLFSDLLKKFNDHRHNGTDSQQVTVSDTSGTLGMAHGGTNATSIASGVVTSNGTTLSSESPVTVTHGGLGVATLAAHGPLLGNGTSAVTVAGAGTTGQLFTSNGASADPSFQSPGISLVKNKLSTDFSARNNFTNTGGGTGALGSWGSTLRTPGTVVGSSKNIYHIFPDNVVASSCDLFKVLGTFTAMVNMDIQSATAASGFIGMGTPTVASTGHTFTTDHIGFKLINASGVVSLYATVGSSGAETASSALTTVATGDVLELYIQVLSNTQSNFYWRKNFGALSAATGLTYNTFGSAATSFQHSLANDNNTTDNQFTCICLGYEI